jgi:outer membrane protein TolC
LLDRFNIRRTLSGFFPLACSGFRAARLFAALALPVFLSACTASHYRKAADRETYSIVQSVEKQLFGHTNEFTINTPFSNRDPKEIPPSELIDDRTRTNTLALGIEDALNLAVTNSRTYQAEKERLYLTALSLTGERYEFGPQFFGNVSPQYRRFATGEKQGVLATDIGLSQTFKTGGRISTAIANDLLRYYTGDPRRSAISTISINLVQPILRGLGRANPAIEALTQAERNVIYAVRDYSFFQDDFALGVVSDYFNLLAQKDVLRNRYTNYLSRVQATERLQARSQDRESAADVDQARQAELTAKNNYVNAVATYQNSLDQFKVKLGLPLTVRLRLDDELLNELESNGVVPVTLDSELAFQLAVKKQLKILNEIDRFEDSKRKIVVAANQLRADINILADASLDSEGDTDFTKFDPNKIRAGVGLQLNLPLDRLRERNQYRATLVSFESQLRSLTLSLDTLRDQIERGLRTLEQGLQTYEIQKNALHLADRRVMSATLLLEAGRAEVRDLVEAQDAQVAAQNAVTSALVSYQEQRLRLMLNLGLVETESNKFWLKNRVTAELTPRPGMLTRSGAVSGERVVDPNQLFEN